MPEPLPGQDVEDSDVSSQLNYTPINSEFTSDAEAGAQLGSEATSPADEESSDGPDEAATADPYEEEGEVARYGAAESFSLKRIPEQDLD
eukprot:8720965-Alexandrium_andersonii.AAC.1